MTCLGRDNLQSFFDVNTITLPAEIWLRERVEKRQSNNLLHRVAITEGASAQFLIRSFNFGPYGQLRTAMEFFFSIMNYYLLLGVIFSCFYGQKFSFNKNIVASALKSWII